MRKLLMVLVLMMSGLVAGCQQQRGDSGDLSATGSQGLLDSTDQRNRRLRYIENVNSRMLIDDWDMVWLQERGSRLSPYITYVGR